MGTYSMFEIAGPLLVRTNNDLLSDNTSDEVRDGGRARRPASTFFSSELTHKAYLMCHRAGNHLPLMGSIGGPVSLRNLNTTNEKATLGRHKATLDVTARIALMKKLLAKNVGFA